MTASSAAFEIARGIALPGLSGGEVRNQHDPSAAAAELAGGGAAQQEIRARIHVHRLVPRRGIGLREGPVDEIRRGSDEEIEAAERGQDPGDQPLALRRPRELGSDRHGPRAEAADLGRRGLGLLARFPVVHRDVASGGGPLEGDRAAEAHARARDERDPPGGRAGHAG
jgi:hypothetical protein